jgi:hypothetical protein
MSKLLTAIILSLAVTLLGGGSDETPAAEVAPPTRGLAGSTAIPARRTETAKVLLALGRRGGDRATLRKAADKLATLNDGQIRLIASLSERVVGEGGPATDVALLLLTALLILS